MNRETNHVLLMMQTFKTLIDTEEGMARIVYDLKTCEEELTNTLQCTPHGSLEEKKLYISLRAISELRENCLDTKGQVDEITKILEIVWKENDEEGGVPSSPKTSPVTPAKDAKPIPIQDE